MKIPVGAFFFFLSFVALAKDAPEYYDVFVAGGTLDAVRAAVRARHSGKSVFLAAPRPYCGEDRAATLDLTLHRDDDESDSLIREIFNPAYCANGAYKVLPAKVCRADSRANPQAADTTGPVTGGIATVTTPLLVKRACDRALLAAKVKFQTATLVTAAKRDGSGDWLVTCLSRSGEKTVRVGEFVDCRMRRRIPAGPHRFSYRVVRGPRPHVETMTFDYDVAEPTALGMLAAENHARDLVNVTNLLDVAEWAVCEDAALAADPAPDTVDLPVLASCDVVVAGGGTGGGPAAVAATRLGARTILVEYQNVLGGVVSEGRIGGYGAYYDGNVCGFTKELERNERMFGSDAKCAYFFARSESLRREIIRHGGSVWTGTMVVGARKDKNRLTGVVVVLPDGTRGVIRCKVAVDATGNSDLAAAAGAETEFISADELSLQGSGMAGQPLGAACVNSDVGFVDETDAADLCFFALRSRLSLSDRVWNQSSLVDSRERRRIVGDFRISPVDIFLNRRYPDVICTAQSSFDTHGQTVHPIFFIRDTGRRGALVTANVPYRALLPRGVEGVIVTGLGVSAHRDAMPVLRMKADIQNQGYAAGLAAAMAAADGATPRDIDVRKLQERLVERGNLASEVLNWKDTLPLSNEAIEDAVGRIRNDYDGLPEVMSDPTRAIPLLRRETGFECVHVRALLGDSTAAEGMIAKLEGIFWDDGWNYRGMSQYVRSAGTVDRYVVALGRTKSKKALPVLHRLAAALTAADEYSHFRALALAYESVGDRSGAAPLARLLKLDGVGGHAIDADEVPPIPGHANSTADAERSDCLRELCVARALFRLGDVEGLGEKTLMSYSRDPRRAYANHARKVLESGRKPSVKDPQRKWTVKLQMSRQHAVFYYGEDVECSYAVNGLRMGEDASFVRAVRIVVTDWHNDEVCVRHLSDSSGTCSFHKDDFKGFGVFSAQLLGEDRDGNGLSLGHVRFAYLTGKSKPATWCGTGVHGWGDRAKYEQIARAGIGVVRNDYIWPSSEKEKGVYRENRAVQKDVATMRELGIVPHMILNGANRIYENPIDQDAFSSWIRWALKTDLKDVDTFEVWNEAWNNYFGKKFGSSEKNGWIRRFAAFSKAAAQTLHEVRPNANVMVCAEDGSKTLQWMMDEGIAGPDDIVSFHPYVHSKDPRPERRKFFFADEGESLRAHGKRHGVTRFRATEAGWTTYSLNADGSHEHWFVGDYPSVTYEEQANYIIRAYLISRSCGLEAMMQYDFRDDGPKRSHTEHNFGLVFQDLTPKPAFAAVAFMTRLLGEARPLGRVGEFDRKAVRQYAFELSNGRKAYAMWAVENPVEVDVPDDVRAGFLFDLMGNRSDLGDLKRVALTESPVYLVERKK